MQTTNYWEQFVNTGKIEDYLSYKSMLPAGNACNRMGVSAGRAEDMLRGEERRKKTEPYAGIY